MKKRGGKIFHLLWILFLIAGFFVLPKMVQAQEKHVVINEIYCDGNNDWVELYNPSDNPIDLLINNFRLYKAKSSSPSLVMRIGNAIDGSYPGQTIIPGKGYYLIVRDDALDNFKNLADAIGTKDSFTWDCEGYTLYLGSNTISSDSDSDIVDKVGYGIANFFEGERAFASDGEKSIERKTVGVDTDNNYNDFFIQDTPSPQNTLWKETNPEPEPIPEPDPAPEPIPDPEPEPNPEPEPISYSNLIKFNEIYPYPEENKSEFIEVVNKDNVEINLENWKIEDKSGHKFIIGSQNIDPGGLIYFERNFYLNNSGEETVSLYNPNGDLVDAVSYENALSGESYSIDELSAWNWTKIATPGESNVFESEQEDNNSEADDDDNPPEEIPDYSNKIKINEIYPAPNTKEGESEFVEIKNLSDEDIDFSKWCLKDKIEYDKADKGSCKKISEIKKTGDFYVFYGTFSLNNDSKGDSVFLYDSSNNLIDNQPYQSTKSEYSYAYDAESSAWRWTSKKTPGAKNEFDKILSGKIKKDDPVYVGIYADFSVDTDADAEKFTWDFGDGHKSYLKETKHKYEKTGEYNGSLKISGNGEDSQYFFTVKVEKYKAPKIRIASFSPNPKGVDTKKEWIEIENKSKKKINLNGWSIAMGRDNLVNHPIREDFILKSGKSKKLTQKICAFTLNNTKTKIELRDPSGKIVQKIKYDRTSNKIEEDEIYQKTENGWQWIDSQSSTKDTKNNTEETVNNTAEIQIDAGETQTSTDEVPTDASEMQNNTEENVVNMVNNVIQTDDIEENPQVLGAEIVKNSESIETLNIKSNNSNFGKQRLLSSLIRSLNQKISIFLGFVIGFF